MEFYGNFFGSGYLQQTRRFLVVEVNLSVRGIVTDGQVMIFGKVDCFLKKVKIGGGSCGVVGVVQPHELRFDKYLNGNCIEVRQEVVLLCQGHEIGFTARYQSAHRVHRVSRIGHQRYVARLNKAQGNVSNPLLGSDERKNLFLRVQNNPEAPLVPFSDGLSKLRQAICLRVPMICRVMSCSTHMFDDMGRRRQVRVPYCEAHDVLPSGPLLFDLPVYVNKKIRRQLSEPCSQIHFRSPLSSNILR